MGRYLVHVYGPVRIFEGKRGRSYAIHRVDTLTEAEQITAQDGGYTIINLMANQKPMPPELSKLINDNYEELMAK